MSETSNTPTSPNEHKDTLPKSREIARWGDSQQYYSEPMPEEAKRGPVVTLINATPDPLGSLAAICGIYSGKIYRSLREVKDEDRKAKFQDMMNTVLNGSLEVAQFHFLIEGVSRSFTHQAVRARGAFYAQESLRFAVKENWVDEVHEPPSFANLPEDHMWRAKWKRVLNVINTEYTYLVNDGMPAEEARDLLPHAVTTRYHWVVDLRGLLQEAGKRTCTQAQFAWRLMFAQVAKALREYGRGSSVYMHTVREDAWQFEFIADQLRPNCFQTGSCGFMAAFDRGCSIRERVEIRAKNGGTDPSQWHKPFLYYATAEDGSRGVRASEGINNWEWAADPNAARK